MHEVEIQQGLITRLNDGRGIERIRNLAYKLESLQPDMKVDGLSRADTRGSADLDERKEDMRQSDQPAQSMSEGEGKS